MQIDGHHAATYATARLGGFSHGEAEVIFMRLNTSMTQTMAVQVHCADSEYLYYRIASAHDMIDYTNLIDVENHLAWLPFHFLPGNGLLPAGQNPPGHELEKLICKPDSCGKGYTKTTPAPITVILM